MDKIQNSGIIKPKVKIDSRLRNSDQGESKVGWQEGT